MEMTKMSEETPPKPKQPKMTPPEKLRIQGAADFSGTNIDNVSDEIRDWTNETEETKGSKMYGVRQ